MENKKILKKQQDLLDKINVLANKVTHHNITIKSNQKH